MPRLDFVPKTQEQGELHHYLRLNFKVTIVSEEKQEELASVVMDVQAGHTVSDPALLHQLSIYDDEPGYDGFPVAAPRWIGAGAAMAADTLHALLPPRGTGAVYQHDRTAGRASYAHPTSPGSGPRAHRGLLR